MKSEETWEETFEMIWTMSQALTLYKTEKCSLALFSLETMLGIIIIYILF